MLWIVVPFIIVAFLVLLLEAAVTLTSIADLHCPICGKRFSDVFGMRKHEREEARQKS